MKSVSHLVVVLNTRFEQLLQMCTRTLYTIVALCVEAAEVLDVSCSRSNSNVNSEYVVRLQRIGAVSSFNVRSFPIKTEPVSRGELRTETEPMRGLNAEYSEIEYENQPWSN